MEIDLRIINGDDVVDIFTDATQFIFKAEPQKGGTEIKDMISEENNHNETPHSAIGFETPKFLEHMYGKW